MCFIGLLARSPEYPQRIRVASVFEPFTCLFVCLIVLCLSANFLIFLLLTSSFIDCLLCYLNKREPTFTGPLQYTIGQTDPDVYPDTDTDTDMDTDTDTDTDTDVYPDTDTDTDVYP